MVQAVLFDLGGTLHVSETSAQRKLWFAERLLNRLGDYGIRLDTTPELFSQQLFANTEAYKHSVESTLVELSGVELWNDWFLRDYHIGRDRLAPIAEELCFLYDYEHARILRRPHLVETLEALRGMGVRMGIISNIISHSVVPHFLAEYGISEYMDCIVTSCGTGIRKPSAEIFRVAEREMGLKPSELAYVGDTLSRDVRGVRNAGWQLMIQIRNPATAHRDKGLAGSGLCPDYSIDDLAEIPAIIRAKREGGSPDKRKEVLE